MALSLLEAMSESCFRRQELNMVIVGIDGAGKTSILEGMKRVFANGKKVRSIPLEKIQPTLGLNIAKIDLCGCRVMFWDLGGATQMRGLWERYYSDCHGWIFVVDCCDPRRLEEARDAFKHAWNRPELKDLPCLIVANKQDRRQHERDDEDGAIGAFFAFTNSNSQGDRRARYQPASAVTTEGIRDGIVWLVGEAAASQQHHQT